MYERLPASWWRRFCWRSSRTGMFSLYLLVLSAENAANNLDQDQVWQNVRPDLVPSCLMLWWYFGKNFSKKSVLSSWLMIVAPIVGFCNCSMFCCALLGTTHVLLQSSFAIILMGKREMVALLCLSSWSLVIVVWLFLMMPRVCLRFVIVVFPDHTDSQMFLIDQTHYVASKTL